SRIRIFVASDAVAHGADVPDIYRSIQYGMPRHKSCNMLAQRFGRAGRGEGLSGEAIFMVESRWRGPCDELGVRLPEELIVPTLRPKKRLTNAQLRGKLPFTLWRLVNEDQVCLRAIQLTHYGDPQSTVSKDLCCSNCNPAIFMDCEYDIRTSHSADIAKTRREPMLSNIQKWFTQWAEARYQDTLWTPTVNCVI
ncbi:uncharacterized protein K441DRAFT_480309, partial [Cenococcum geophilum 1.58]